MSFSKISLVLGIVMSSISCMSPEKLLNNPSTEKIYFGRSGGFTNIPMDYVLIGRKYVYKIEQDKFNHVARLTAKQYDLIKDKVIQAGLPGLQLNEPGNMTYYIRMTDGANQKEVKWNDQTSNAGIKELYKALLSTINN